MDADVPQFKLTPIDSFPQIVNGLRATYESRRTTAISFRLVQLRKLYWGLRDNEAAICSALRRDLGKSIFESYVGEIEWCKNDIIFTCKNLRAWAKDEHAPDVPILNRLINPKIRKEPLGCVLVIGCVQGAVAETTALLGQTWDKIFYTGSARVAKLIATKAAQTLTPYTLELGGNNPAIVTANADLRLAAKRLLWGKLYNAGQICLGQNYILIEKIALPKFVAEMKAAIQEFYPDGARASSDYGRIINRHHWQRLKHLVDKSTGRVLLGGTMDESDLVVDPTIIQVDDINDILMTNENFGPIITIYPVEDLSEAIRIAKKVHNTPLATYSFGTKSETDRILNEIRSGGASVNDSWVHGTVPTLAFGGVGESGSGAYRGRASFECFTHRKSYTTTPSWGERLLALRYPPYEGKLDIYQRITGAEPDFNRDGIQQGLLTRYGLALAHGSLKLAALIQYSLFMLLRCVSPFYNCGMLLADETQQSRDDGR
ncbi:MAG: hypothetical protein Q9179_005176 [Wetmoreana sp. 5 TL-2023]